MNDARNYRENISTFVSSIEGRFVKEISFDIEKDPTFDLSLIPFQFLYCNQILFDTEDGTYSLITSQTSTALDTFWIKKDTNKFYGVCEKLVINSHARVVSVDVKHHFTYKIHLQFNSQHIILVAGDIYDNPDGSLTYKVQNEMIIVFKDVESANIFDRLTKCG